MLQNPVSCFLKTFLISGPNKRVQKNVVGLKSGVGFQLAAPVAVFVLLRKEVVSRSGDRRADAAAKSLNFAETKLWSAPRGGRK